MTAILAKPLIFDPSSLMFSSFGGNASLVDMVQNVSGLGLKGLTSPGVVGLESNSGTQYLTINNNGTQMAADSFNILLGAGATWQFYDSLTNGFLAIKDANQGLLYLNSNFETFSFDNFTGLSASFGVGGVLMNGIDATLSLGSGGTLSSINNDLYVASGIYSFRVSKNNGRFSFIYNNNEKAYLDNSGDLTLLGSTIQLGGISSSFPMLKQGNDAFGVNTLLVRKADDSADARLQASSILASSQLGLIDSGTNLGLYGNQANKLLTVQSAYKLAFTNVASAAGGSEDIFLSRGAAGKLLLDDAGTHTPMIQFGGTTSSFYGIAYAGSGQLSDGTSGLAAVRADSISTLTPFGAANFVAGLHGYSAIWGGSGYDLIMNGNGGSPYIGIGSAGVLRWSNSAGATGTPDVELARQGTGALSFLLNTALDERARLSDGTDQQTCFMVSVNRTGSFTLERVTLGAADSGGSGFKLLRVPN